MNQINEKYIWDIIEDYFDKNTLSDIQINSFDEFINIGIQRVINEEADIDIELKDNQKIILSFGDVYISSPSVIEDDRSLKLIYPSYTRERDLNYDSSIYCDITEKIYDEEKLVEENYHRRISIARIPIMLMSSKCNLVSLSNNERIKAGECENDRGGYFIIKGNERVIISQLRSNYNQVIVLKQKPGEKFSHTAEIRSMSEETGHSIQLKAMVTSDNRSITFSLPYIRENIPVGIVFKALGIINNEDIIQFIGLDCNNAQKFMRLILRESFFIQTQEQALMYIGQYSIHIIPKEKRKVYALQVVETELFPHMGISSTTKEKSILLGYIIKKLISTVLGIREHDDRDNYSLKRIETCGMLCTELFRTLFKRFINTIKLQLDKKKSRIDLISTISRLNTITQGLRHSFAVGNWGIPKNSYVRTGVSQVLSRLKYGATLSHLRRIAIPIGKEAKNAKIRQIHTSQFGYVAPCESPEGQSAGIVLNFSLLCKVTKKIPIVLVKEILENNEYIIPISSLKINAISTSSHVFVNGNLIGMTEDPDSLVEDIKKLRRLRRLDQDISVTYDMIDDDVKIFCDNGRFTRPLFSLDPDDNSKLKIKKEDGTNWNDLLYNNLIEYIDNSEIENYVIAMDQTKLNSWKNDYCEIHPSMMLGVLGNTIPFPDHNPSPRNAYYCSMGKQALGMYALSYKKRTDTITYILDYPQKSLVSTKPADFMKFNEMPSGINAIVAIMSYTGLML
jgi:DNA-directed RNA polymerase II subunit RPB2